MREASPHGGVPGAGEQMPAITRPANTKHGVFVGLKDVQKIGGDETALIVECCSQVPVFQIRMVASKEPAHRFKLIVLRCCLWP